LVCGGWATTFFLLNRSPFAVKKTAGTNYFVPAAAPERIFTYSQIRILPHYLKTELAASIQAVRQRKQGSQALILQWLVQSAKHFRQAFEFLRLVFCALREYVKNQAKLATLHTLAGLEWLLRQENSASCPQSDAKNGVLSNAEKVDGGPPKEDAEKQCSTPSNCCRKSAEDGFRL
jgi:hypothetical protein